MIFAFSSLELGTSHFLTSRAILRCRLYVHGSGEEGMGFYNDRGWAVVCCQGTDCVLAGGVVRTCSESHYVIVLAVTSCASLDSE